VAKFDKLSPGDFLYADTWVMGAVSGAGTGGGSTFFSSFGGSGFGSALGGRVILRGSSPLIRSPYCFLIASHLIWK